jgi:hypothetical protein
MKKKSLKSLTLNKKSISNFDFSIQGGTNNGTLINFNCRLTDNSFCDCASEPCNTHTYYDCDI